jgi:uncharacterized membrane protein YraQ (UPF0718 family)
MSVMEIVSAAGRRKRDWLLLGGAAALAALAAVAPQQALESLRFTAENLFLIAPFIAFAVLLAAYSEAAGAGRIIAQVFSGRIFPMILAAAAFGALSPFCSCGVIPIIAALLAMGMPLPAVMAFWLASPVMDPEMFVLTAGALGLEFALAKTLAAFSIGLFGGTLAWLIGRAGFFEDSLKQAPSACGLRSFREPKAVNWIFWRDPDARSAFLSAAGKNALFLARWLSLAFFLESLMLAYLPAEAIGRWVGGESDFAVPLAALVGAPAYLNGYAAIPTTEALMTLGMTSGAALSFMVAGAVTSIPAAIAVFALVRLPVFLTYIALGMIGSMLAGWGFQLWLA